MYEEEKQDLLKKRVESQALTRELETAIASPFLMEGPDEARFASRKVATISSVYRERSMPFTTACSLTHYLTLKVKLRRVLLSLSYHPYLL